jgi:hypothetical protein
MADSEFAFPSNEKDDGGLHYHSHSGMSLRDWFAGMVISGALSNPNIQGGPDEWAADSYRVADAMLAAREVR